MTYTDLKGLTNGYREGLTEFVELNLSQSEAILKLYKGDVLLYVGHTLDASRLNLRQYHKFDYDRVQIAYYIGDYFEEEVDKIILSEKPLYNRVLLSPNTVKTAIRHINRFLKNSKINSRMTECKFRKLFAGRIHEYNEVEYVFSSDIEKYENQIN